MARKDTTWNVDKHNESSNNRKWGLKNKEKRNIQRKERRKDPEYVKEKNEIRNKSAKERYQRLRTTVFKIIGGFICIDCGYNDQRAMQIEHIHNTGNLDKKRFHQRRDQMFLYYSRNPIEAFENLEPVCANCNQIRIHQRENS